MAKIPLSPAVGGLPTFYGAYLLNKQQIIESRGWNEVTLKEYESSLVNIICPSIKEHNFKPLSAYTQEDIDAAIKTIKANGYQKKADTISRYDQATLERFRYLMEVVIDASVENFVCPDILHKKKRASEGAGLSRKKPIPRSISPEQELRVGEILLTNPKQSGEYMALAAMFCGGPRNGEACGLNYEDIRRWKDFPNLWGAWIYKTTKIDSNEPQSSGKTRNADRVVVLPDRFVRLVNERKKWLQEWLIGVDVEKLPIACRGDDPFCRCKADDVTEAAKEMFQQAGIMPEQVCEAFDLVRKGDFEELVALDSIEETPTAYLLRRHYGSSLAAMGLTEQEIRFQIGHEMDGPVETRNEFMCDDRLQAIKRKLDRRAVVNTDPEAGNHVYPSPGKTIRIRGTGRQVIHIPAGASCIILQLDGREPMDQIRICVRNPANQPGNVNITTGYHRRSYSADPDIHEDYLKLYHNEGK